MCKFSATLALVLLTCVSAFSANRAPLPKKIVEAKTVYLDNRTGDANLGDKAYDELTKWGKYKVVQEVTDADLVFVLTTETWAAGNYTYGSVNQYGGVSARSVPVQSGTTCLTIFDRVTGQQLWAHSKDWGRFKSATRGIIKELKERME